MAAIQSIKEFTVDTKQKQTRQQANPRVRRQVPEAVTDEQTGYYTSTGRKVGDFCIGFFGLPFVFWITQGIVSLPMSLFGVGFSVALLAAGTITSIAMMIAGVWISFAKGRKWIGIGSIACVMLSLVLVTLLFVALMNMSW